MENPCVKKMAETNDGQPSPTHAGLASRMVEHCFGESVNETTLTDDMIDGLFGQIDTDGGGSLDAEEIAGFLEAEGLGGKEELETLLKSEMVGRSVTDTMVQMSAKHIQIMKTEMVSFVLHIIHDVAGGMSGHGRHSMIESGVIGIITREVRAEKPAAIRVVALQALHALLSDRFSLEDVMADDEFEGYFADILQLSEVAARSDDAPTLTFAGLTVRQRRKVHIVAQFAKMHHRSVGPPDDRAVVVSAPPATFDTEVVGGGGRSPRAGLAFENPIHPADEGAGAPEAPTPKYEVNDPWDQSYYDRNRNMAAASGVVPILCEIVVDATIAEPEVVFNALDVLVLLLQHNCLPAAKHGHLLQAEVQKICSRSLSHPNIGIAVLAAWGLDYIISRKEWLFTKKFGIERFRKAVRQVMTYNQTGHGVAHGELDRGVQQSRAALR